MDEFTCVGRKIQTQRPRAYTGQSRATEFRRKKAQNALEASAEGTRPIESYFVSTDDVQIPANRIPELSARPVMQILQDAIDDISRLVALSAGQVHEKKDLTLSKCFGEPVNVTHESSAIILSQAYRKRSQSHWKLCVLLKFLVLALSTAQLL